ncbi:AIR synthase related protein [Tepidimicrobium xylanilyticum]|uniref:AIR synthase related protein n=1 Tax=Tepidimicrobium xylanilyticum TaxID=1123352 RepID=UPI00295E783B|nr:AIR synthase related protein [Tepidimicrobium xylanilyticum]
MKGKLIERYRDLIIIYEKDMAYVISCDSLGAIGNKKNDVLKTDEDTVGKATIKVALSEALCVGANPIVICDTLAVEMNPTGNRILKSIKKELKENGLDDIVLTGSTEENFPTSMTGIGITIISRAKISDLKIKKVEKGMHISLLGYPLVGEEVLKNPKDVLQLKDYMEISNSKEIIEAIPVGSKGIGYELRVLEEVSGLKVEDKIPPHVDIMKSGGPSTCCIIVHKEKKPSIMNTINKPLTHMGRLV